MSKYGARILIVDDEQEIVRALERSLRAFGYQVFTATNGNEAIEAVSRYRPDLLVLDLGLPGMSGLEVCRQVRAASNIPIIVLSIKDAEHDKIEALDLGADDYVSKPFNMGELLARIRVALRHLAQAPAGAEPLIRVGPLRVNLSLREVVLDGQKVSLTPTEYELLKIFLTHRGKILTRRMLLNQLWGDEAYARAHSLHVFVAQLRRKIEPDPDQPLLIQTIPGVGYRFADDSELGEQASVRF